MAMTVFYLATGGCFYFLFIKPSFLTNSKRKKSELLTMKGASLKKKAAKTNA
ncbi:hypothetical protein NLX67_07715 [Domibacillus sp. A3M-37]|uniref:hypothetical protein n=1 Tax=Domibacillus sp. A3M-37 TaxID=2962037 RepID=UPI000ABE303A|nr:hypothetical protein [Domibacillus sp. A3M-37]MCP3762274.1 hypothetical protein [Domibacillus sp. A3M-37]